MTVYAEAASRDSALMKYGERNEVLIGKKGSVSRVMNQDALRNIVLRQKLPL